MLVFSILFWIFSLFCKKIVPNDSKDKEEGITGRIPENNEQATGLERVEMEAERLGNPDPFRMNTAPHALDADASGSVEKPFEIPSFCDDRIVGLSEL